MTKVCSTFKKCSDEEFQACLDEIREERKELKEIVPGVVVLVEILVPITPRSESRYLELTFTTLDMARTKKARLVKEESESSQEEEEEESLSSSSNEEEDQELGDLSCKIRISDKISKIPFDVETIFVPTILNPGEVEEGICVICQDTLKAEEGDDEEIKTVFCCKTKFHGPCISSCLNASKQECPICKTIFGALVGDSPKGEMSWTVDLKSQLPGFPKKSGIVTIVYSIPSGIQGKNHPNPGQRFDGTHRYAYLPFTKEGKHVLELLKKAFAARLTFTVGTSLTTGQSNTVIWSGIHHKTNISGGSFGYPDATYLSRVQEELKSKGIV